MSAWSGGNPDVLEREDFPSSRFVARPISSATQARVWDVLGFPWNDLYACRQQHQLTWVVYDTSTIERREDVRSRLRDGWEHVQRRLTDFANLPCGWDGEDGSTPPSVILDSAQQFAAEAMQHEAPVPELYIDGGGEVGFRWRKFDWFASVAFLDDGHAVIYLDRPWSGDPVRIDALWNEIANRKTIYDGLQPFA